MLAMETQGPGRNSQEQGQFGKCWALGETIPGVLFVLYLFGSAENRTQGSYVPCNHSTTELHFHPQEHFCSESGKENTVLLLNLHGLEKMCESHSNNGLADDCP